MEGSLLQISYTLENIDAAVQQFWNAAANCHILAFSGDMGAGKTTFINRLCQYLHVPDPVSSPTFALVNQYSLPGSKGTIFHIDLYRLKDTEDAINAGMEDCIDQTKQDGVYCFIEWPEKAPSLLRRPYLWISIEAVGMAERKMTVSRVG